MSISRAPSPTAQRISSKPQRQRHQAGGKAGRDRGDRDARAVQRLDRRRHHGRIDADRADASACDRGRAPRRDRARSGFRALAQSRCDARRRVVAGERRQVDAGDRLDQPGRLPFLLHGAAGGQRRGAALDGGEVDPRAFDPVGMERRAVVPRKVLLLHAPASTTAGRARKKRAPVMPGYIPQRSAAVWTGASQSGRSRRRAASP